jgi:hypothetical protein
MRQNVTSRVLFICSNGGKVAVESIAMPRYVAETSWRGGGGGGFAVGYFYSTKFLERVGN